MSVSAAVNAAFDALPQVRCVALDKGGRVKNVLSTGSLILDLILGGGLQRGRIADFFGPEGSGKTTVVLGIVASAQQVGVPCVFFDFEHSLDPMYMHNLGVDLDFKVRHDGRSYPGFRYVQPGPGEDTYKLLRRALRRMHNVDPKKPGVPQCLFVVDSFAAMYSEKTNDDDKPAGLGVTARMHAEWLTKLKGLLHDKGCLLVFTNQIRFKIDLRNPGMNPEQEPGGNAMKFYADYKIRVSARKKGEDDKIGVSRQHLFFRTIKNKCFAPFRVCEHEIILGRGLDKAQDAFEFLSAIGMVENNRGRYTIKLKKFDVGKSLTWREFRQLTESPKFRSYAFALLRDERVYGRYFKTAGYQNYVYDQWKESSKEDEE